MSGTAVQEFTPASPELERYDADVRLYAREAEWRPLMASRIDLQPGQTFVDIGAGTGSLAIALQARCPQARIVAVDPDPQVLAIARRKAAAARADIDWREAFVRAEDWSPGSVNHVACSLVLHQVPLAEKRRLLATMTEWIGDHGTLHIADYGRQRGTMRTRFRQTVQAGDGIADTQPNADGAIERMFVELGLRRVGRDRHFRTRSGLFSLFSRRAR